MRIGVLMGGRSPEREISLKTGKNIAAGLRKCGYDVVEIDACENIADDIKREKIDLAYIALHGPLGEDGTIQGMLEFMGIPFTGAGVMCSAVAMNKVMTKRVMDSAGIKHPPYYAFNYSLLETDMGLYQIAEMAKAAKVDFPVIVKPSAGGSTIGTNIVKDACDLISAYKDAAKYCSEILVEKFIPGTEITVGVLGDENPKSLPVIEIIPVGGFYNYTTKYQPNMSTHIIPARIPEHLYKKAQEIAVDVFNVLHCYGMGRVDFIVEGENLWFLEINTIPGMTETSLLPEAAEKDGISFENLLKSQVEYALKRHEKMKEVCYV